MDRSERQGLSRANISAVNERGAWARDAPACTGRIIAASCPVRGEAHSPARSRRQGAVKLSSSACGKHPTHTHAPRCTHHARRGCRPRHLGMRMCARAPCPRRKYLHASCSEAFPSGPLQTCKGRKGGIRRTGVHDNALCRRVCTSWPHLEPISRLTIMGIAESGGLSGCRSRSLARSVGAVQRERKGEMY